MKRIIIVIGLIVIFISVIHAQNETDALRYSQVNYGGTARATAMGDAFGVLGGDFSSLSINPAGIGIYKSKEISITLGNYFVKMKSEYNKNETDDFKYNFNLNSAGAVFSFVPKKESVCKAIQIGFGFNRLNNFNYNGYFEGENYLNSIVDDFLSKAEGTVPNDLYEFDAKLAFNTFLIDTAGSLIHYVSPIFMGGTLQSKSISVSGSSNEMVITLGGNFNDKLYIGGTVGFPFVKYTETSSYEETDMSDSIPEFKKMTFNQFLNTQGTGFNFKFGIIYRPADWVRIGASIHTPTFYSMKDKWSSDITAYYDDGTKYYSESPNGVFDYQLNSPFRANGGFAFVISKYALISAEYEYVDYRNARLRSSTVRFTQENRAIHDLYTIQSNVRAGFEVKPTQMLSIRGGYAYNSSPYKSNINDGVRHTFSGGLGLRFDKFFVDLAYSYIMSKEKYYLYSSVPYPVNNSIGGNNVLLTFGMKLK